MGVIAFMVRRAEINAYVRKLADEFKPERVILFGSYMGSDAARSGATVAERRKGPVSGRKRHAGTGERRYRDDEAMPRPDPRRALMQNRSQ
jgi:hypothetical protein